MGSKSRTKGAGFENHIAKLVSASLGVTYKRTPLSGGWAKASKIAAGDLVPVDSEQRFCFECKKVEGWTLDGIFAGKCSLFSSWWKQCIEECPPGILPILVFSRNRAPIYVALRRSDFTSTVVPILSITEGGDTLSIMLLDAVLQHFRQSYSV